MKSLGRKSNETDSPKTPGGISKSHLTPIRRLGLSRKWKKSGPSPFVSPLAGNIVKNNENDEDEILSRKRKLCVDEEIQSYPPLSPATDSKDLESNEIRSTPPPAPSNVDIENTPVRRISVTRKKSKLLISSPVNSEHSEVSNSVVEQNNGVILNKQKSNDFNENKPVEDIGLKQKTTNKIAKNNKSPRKLIAEEGIENKETKEDLIKVEDKGSKLQNKEMCMSEVKVPNLTKECIVVIQKKIFKPVNNKTQFTNKEDCKENNSMSQVLFDSDTDDVPLSSLNKRDLKQKQEKSNISNLDDDFINNTNKEESSNKFVSNSCKKANIPKKVIEEKIKQKKKEIVIGKIDPVQVNPLSQKFKNFDDDDDDDDDFEVNKKTILIRKSYDKVIKPTKSKSTGSITQKDVDELRTRIKMKKKLLIAKSMTKDTEELRGLIKKWQKGCQEALMQLLDLMRKKQPDQSNRNYSYILEMLKIPPSLVGYDEENECFNTPDDNTILTTAFNDI